MSKGDFIWECTNKKCNKRLVYWAETILGNCNDTSSKGKGRNGNVHHCPKCNHKLERYYTTCDDCGNATCGGMSSCANCYEK